MTAHVCWTCVPRRSSKPRTSGSYNVPLHLLREHRDEISRHLDQVVLVCRSGNRAAQAELVLAETGMTNLHLLDGGILAWQDAGAPLRQITDGGTVRS